MKKASPAFHGALLKTPAHQRMPSRVRKQLFRETAHLACALLCVGVSLSKTASAQPSAEQGSEQVFTPKASVDLGELSRRVALRSPQLQAEQLNVDLAASEVQQSHLFNNPELDVGWGTIPIGETNPPDLKAPFANVPNYSVGLSYTIPVGKRGPRQRRATALESSARATLVASTRDQALELGKVLGTLATANLRLDGLQGLREEGQGTIELAKSRLSAGFGTPLDVDRLEIDLSRIEQQVLSNQSETMAAQASCSALVGVPCAPFESVTEARSFLMAWVRRASAPLGIIEERPDIKAIEAEGHAARAEAELARAQALPDPTVRFGYVHDRFVESGNQMNSLNLTLSLPLPIFDRGQAMERAAEARSARLAAQRSRLISSARVRADSLRKTLQLQIKRQTTITEQMLPRARAVLDDLEKAANNRLIPFTDVIPARRTVNELLLEEADSFGDAFQTAVELLALSPDPSRDQPLPTQPTGPESQP